MTGAIWILAVPKRCRLKAIIPTYYNMLLCKFASSFFFRLIFLGQKGDCTVSISDSDLMDMVTGKIGAQKVCI